MAKFTWNSAQVTRVGLDLAKNVFQIHGVDALGFVGLVIVRHRRRAEFTNVLAQKKPAASQQELRDASS